MQRTPRRTARPLALLATLTLGLALTGCGSEETKVKTSTAPTDGVLKMSLLTDPGQPPDPDVFYAGNGLNLTTNIYEGLVKYAGGGTSKIVPSLAEKWEVDKTNTVFTFHLRQGVKFHDGTPLTSAAVQASFERRVAVGGGPAYMADGVKSFQTPDDHTVIITLKQPNSAYLDEMASAYGPKIMSPTGLKKYAGKDHAQKYLTTHDLGTGPYALTVAKTDDRYQIKWFKDYWGTKPDFTTVDFTVYKDTSAQQLAFNHGDLAAIVGGVPSSAQTKYNKSKTIDAYSLDSFQVGVMYTNPNKPFLKTAAARKAMFASVDWAKVIKQFVPETAEIAKGAYSKGALPADVAPADTSYHPELLKKYAATLPAGTKVEIGVAAGGGDALSIANLIAAQLQALKLDAKVTEFKTSFIFGDFYEDRQKAPDIFIADKTWPDSSNPYLYGHIFWDPDGGLNHTGCTDKATSAALAEGLKTGSQEAYAKAAAAEQASGCNPIFAWSHDFAVAQPWLGHVKEAHSVAAPYTLDYHALTLEK